MDDNNTTGKPPKTCADCKHWVKNPIDPANLGAERRGQCRAVPPSLSMLPQSNGQLAKIAAYPDLPASFPACGMHAYELKLVS